jgi:glyoxylase-like metal-dependent hydrolase (beta-lactamase superfamily II)
MKPTRLLVILGALAALCSCPEALAQPASAARPLLESAATAMGGLDRLRGLDSLAMTGFGQRYAMNGKISADPNSPPKWQSVTDAERYFDLRHKRALNQERTPPQFPFASIQGMSSDRRSRVQTGVAVLDHPLPALLNALDEGTTLGNVEVDDGMAVVPFTIGDGSTVKIAIDPQTHLPYWTRWITGSDTLGDVTHTMYFTGYLPFDGVWLPTGLLEKIDWRDQVTTMFQVDSYRLNVPLPAFPPPPAPRPSGPPQIRTTKIADGVWDVRVDNGGSGGAVIEFADHLVMFEPYGNEAQTLARIDAADKLVRGKRITAVIVGHQHEDHAGGLRAAVSRGLTIIAQRRTRAFFEEWVSRPAVHFPDELAKHPQPLKFMPVDEHLVLEDSKHRLDVYHAVGDFHMSDALIAYLPKEKIVMEGDFTDETWAFNWWAGALRANMELYHLDPVTDIPVHGTVGTIDQKMKVTNEQVEAAQKFCADNAARGGYPFGCPVRYTTSGPIAD